MSQIQPADPIARKKALFLLAGGAVLGGLLLWVFDSYQIELAGWFFDDSANLDHRLVWILLALVVLSLPLLFGAFYFLRMGQSVIDAQRFPPPGVPVIRDTPVLTGNGALFRGRLLRYAAVFLCGCAIGVPIMGWWVLRVLLRGP